MNLPDNGTQIPRAARHPNGRRRRPEAGAAADIAADSAWQWLRTSQDAPGAASFGRRPPHDDVEQKLRDLAPFLGRLRRGIERESLRVDAGGRLVLTPHPAALGSALTNAGITTDFSESQIELVTGVHGGVGDCIRELTDLHRFVNDRLDGETLWAASMPCELPGEDAIPIASYGSSNAALAKRIYRMGLARRYGRRMQMISGVHYNFSIPEDAWQTGAIGNASDAYMGLIRNFRRHGWMLLYLFGASPAVNASFVAGRSHAMPALAPDTRYLPFATSLRMTRQGYLSRAQEALCVSCNTLDSYATALAGAMSRPHPAYESIGLRSANGYRQLSTSLLQQESEFYSSIRPKRVPGPGERQLHALRARGIEYVEVRVLDSDAYEAIGIAPQTARFVDVFLLHCLLAPSPPDVPEEIRACARNDQEVAARGRDPLLCLQDGGRRVSLRDWGARVLDQCAPIAAALDGVLGGHAHQIALAGAVDAFSDPESLPSARVLRDVREHHRGSFAAFAQTRSTVHREWLQRAALPAETTARLALQAEASLERQRRMESENDGPFEPFRQRYLSPTSLGEPRGQESTFSE